MALLLARLLVASLLLCGGLRLSLVAASVQCADGVGGVGGCSPVGGALLFVSNYGAVPNDGLDDSAAIQSAINDANTAGPFSTVLLEAGTYRLNTSLIIFEARQLTLRGPSSASTQLLVTDPTTAAIQYYSCLGLTLQSFSIDYSPLPFTGGTVQAVTLLPGSGHPAFPYAVDLQVVAPHTADPGFVPSSLFRYDVVNQRPTPMVNYAVLDAYSASNVPSVLVSPGVLRFFFESGFGLQAGDNVVVRYTAGIHALFGGTSNSDVLVVDVVVYSSPDMGHASVDVTRLTISDYHVRKAPGRWLSTNTDCHHFGSCRESIVIRDSSCEGQGDDGLNVHGAYYNVTSVTSSTVVVLGSLDGMSQTVLVGDVLTFAHPSAAFVPYDTAVVTSVTAYSALLVGYQLSSPVADLTVNDLVTLAHTPSLLLSNFTVRNNRARGALIETDNVLVEGCLFDHTSGPAILLAPSSLGSTESDAAMNVTIRNSVFQGCNQGIAQAEGVIALSPFPVQSASVFRNLTITGNSFFQGAQSQAVLQDQEGYGLLFEDNYANFTSDHSPSMTFCNTQQVSVSHNTFVGLSGASWANDTSNAACVYQNTNHLLFSSDAFTACFPPALVPSASHFGVMAYVAPSGSTAAPAGCLGEAQLGAEVSCDVGTSLSQTNLFPSAPAGFISSEADCFQYALAARPPLCGVLWITEGFPWSQCSFGQPCCFFFPTFPCGLSSPGGLYQFGVTNASVLHCS